MEIASSSLEINIINIYIYIDVVLQKTEIQFYFPFYYTKELFFNLWLQLNNFIRIKSQTQNEKYFFYYDLKCIYSVN